MSEPTREPTVTRYDFEHPVCDSFYCCGGGHMEPDDTGDYVRYDDYLAIVAERDAAVRELEETRKREALSDAIVDECDSDITKLVQERASLRAERDAAVRERDAARDKNVQLHALVKKYKNKATKQSQKQKKNYKLAKYADESNATLRARLAACERVVEAARAVVLDAWKQHGYDQYNVGTATIAALRAALAAATQTTPHAGGTDA